MKKSLEKLNTTGKYDCAFQKVCYIMEAMNCSSCNQDCPLYKNAEGSYLNLDMFHQTVNQLIDKTAAKYQGLL